MLAQPIRVKSWKPSIRLSPVVSEFTFREERIGQAEKYMALSARTDCFLQFYFKDQYRVLSVSSGAIHFAPRCVLVGPHTYRREDLLCTGHLRMFTIRFSAIGFRTLFGIPARLIADHADPADAVLGAALGELEDRLASSKIEQMPIVADAFLLRQLGSHRHPHGSEVAGNLVRSLQTKHGDLPIRHLGELYGLSVRQIERTFLDHVGLTPKVFGRLIRLKRALALGEVATAPDWTDIAALSGYFDQAHMIREFRNFNGATPVQFAAIKRRGSLDFLERSKPSETSTDVAFVQSQAWGEALA